MDWPSIIQPSDAVHAMQSEHMVCRDCCIHGGGGPDDLRFCQSSIYMLNAHVSAPARAWSRSYAVPCRRWTSYALCLFIECQWKHSTRCVSDGISVPRRVPWLEERARLFVLAAGRDVLYLPFCAAYSKGLPSEIWCVRPSCSERTHFPSVDLNILFYIYYQDMYTVYEWGWSPNLLSAQC